MTVSSHLADLFGVMVTTIRDHFPQDIVKEVAMHDGEFDLAAIESHSRKSPAIVLCPDGGKSTKKGNSIYEVHRFDAYIIVRSRSQQPRTRGAMIILEHLLRLLHTTLWNSDEHTYEVASPTNVEDMNMFDGKLDETGLTLWVVRWDQQIRIPSLTTPASLDDFRTLYNRYTTEPGNEIAEGDLEQEITLPGPFT